jgi:NADH:ubiquinone oxidoreductase subunit
MNLSIIFIWWKRQTLGTFIETLLFGTFVGKDEFNNKYYQNKKNKRWVIYSNKIEATKITADWYLWIHHTVDSIPNDIDNKKKYLWQKKHLENQSGSKNRNKPTKIKKNNIQKKYETWK